MFGLGGPEILILAFFALIAMVVVFVVSRGRRRQADRDRADDDKQW